MTASSRDVKPEQEMAKLISEISTLPRPPVALSLAVQVEMIFSSLLLEQCLNLAATDYARFADPILTFLKARYEQLYGTPALNPHSRTTRINRAFILTAGRFALFAPDNYTLKQILSFDKVCENEEKEGLEKQKQEIKTMITGAPTVVNIEQEDPEDKIYKFVYDLVFNVHSIRNAMSYVAKKDEVLGADNWEILLKKMLKYIASTENPRQTFIRVVSYQVEKKDWACFFAKTELAALYKLVLGLDLKKHKEAHERKPVMKQGVHELNEELLDAADKLLHSTFSDRYFGGLWAQPGEAFRVILEKEHGCETQHEVLALACALFYSYSRIRVQLPKYAGKAAKISDWANYFSVLVSVNGKDEKLDACKIIMDFILAKDEFTEVGLHRYVEVEATAGRLTRSAVEKFRKAISEGALKSLLDAMYQIQKDVERELRMKPKGPEH